MLACHRQPCCVFGGLRPQPRAEGGLRACVQPRPACTARTAALQGMCVCGSVVGNSCHGPPRRSTEGSIADCSATAAMPRLPLQSMPNAPSVLLVSGVQRSWPARTSSRPPPPRARPPLPLPRWVKGGCHHVAPMARLCGLALQPCTGLPGLHATSCSTRAPAQSLVCR